MNYNKDILEGKEYFSTGNYPTALECFSKAIQSNPNSKEAYLMEAMTYQHINGWKSKDALSALYRILSLDPDNSVVHRYIELVSSGKLLSQIIELYPICYEISIEDDKYHVDEDEFIVNFIDDVTMRFKIIDDTSVKIVHCDYDKHSMGFRVGVMRVETTEAKSVIIPSFINYYSKKFIVTEIGKRSFHGLDGDSYPLYLTNIEIPNTITKIEENAFDNCSFLKSIRIPKSVVKIDADAFSYCMELEQINIEEGNSTYDSRDNCNAVIETKTNRIIIGCKATKIPQTVNVIGYAAFHGQRMLKSIEIPNSITAIEQSAFLDTGLTRITLPNSLLSIGKFAFSHCDLQSVSLSDSLSIIGDSAFSNNPLHAIVIPKSVKNIGLMAFSSEMRREGIQSIKVQEDNPYFDSRNNCNAIIETNTNTLIFGCSNTSFPNTIKHIGEHAFFDCETLYEVSLPSSIETIGNGAFCQCRNLCKICFPESLTKIGSSAFSGCEKIEELVIPKNVSYIGERAFGGCDNLKSITSINPRPPYLQSDVLFKLYGREKFAKVILRVPMSVIDDYKGAPGWKLFKNILPLEDSKERINNKEVP